MPVRARKHNLTPYSGTIRDRGKAVEVFLCPSGMFPRGRPRSYTIRPGMRAHPGSAPGRCLRVPPAPQTKTALSSHCTLLSL
nr:MAG: hypothetical protein [Molluscum contagiosum virus]